MVEVTGLRVVVFGAGDVAHAHVGGKYRKLAARTVIKNIDFHLVARIVDALRGEHGIAHHVQRFVIGRNINIDRRPRRHIIRQRHNPAIEGPDGLQIVKQKHHPNINFSDK